MENFRVFILTNKKKRPDLQKIVKDCNVHCEFIVSRNDLDNVVFSKRNFLLSHNTSIILKTDDIEKFPAGIYNIHSASPEYPGRDPHHFAIYFGAKTYGATLHILTESVDAGDIIEVIDFAVHADDTPYTLLDKADKAALKLVERTLLSCKKGLTLGLKKNKSVQWGPRKFKRADFTSYCQILPNITQQELERRIKAFYHPVYKNLYLVLHGKKFFIDL